MNEHDPVLRHPASGTAWLAGLRWAEPVRKPPSAGRGGRDIRVSVTVGLRRGAQRLRLCGQRQVPVRWRRVPLFSLALAFSERYRNGYGIFRITDQRWLFLAAQQGLPAVTGDVEGSPEAVIAARDLFLSLNDPPETGWEVETRPEEAVDWSALVQDMSARKRSRLRIHAQGSGNNLILPLIAVIALGAAAAYWFSQRAVPDVLSPDEVARRAKALAAETPSLPPLPHPWAAMPPARAMLLACETAWRTVPVSAGGWLLKGGRCDADGLTLSWTWLPGGTAQSLTASLARHWPDTPPVIDLLNGAQTATVVRPVTFAAGRDEAAPGRNTQLARVTSAFQRQGLSVPFADVSPPDPLPDENGNLPPRPDWQTFSFILTGSGRPSTVTGAPDDTGLRIQSVSFTLNGTAVSYTTEGLLYASR